MDNQLLDFKMSYQTDSGQSVVVLQQKNFTRQQLIDYQVEMLAQNTLPGIIPLEVREHNSEVKLIYMLTGLVNLSEYLKSLKIERADLLALIERILAVVQEAKNYFLNENSLIIHEKYIFLNPKTMEVALLYLPIENKQDLVRNFKAFVINVITNTANIEAEGDLAQQVFQLIHAEAFSLAEFRRELKQLKAACSTPEADPGLELLQYLPLDPLSGQEYITIISPQKSNTKFFQQRAAISTGYWALGVIALVAIVVTIISKVY